MKILVITKRQYMGKDLLDDRFGRFRELPLELAKLGHEVIGISLSYRPRREGLFEDFSHNSDTYVSWYSLNLGRLIIPGLINYLLQSNSLVSKFKPDFIWACSDSFHAIIGLWLTHRMKAKGIVDLYDNFESFGATRLPWVKPLFKRAVREADGVTCVSKTLAKLIFQNYQPKGSTIVLENGARTDLFYPQERTASRKQLRLPEKVKIIGAAGGLYHNRGIRTFFRAFELLANEQKNVHLVIAGPRERRSQIPTGPQVHDLGILPLEKVPILLNAVDLAVIYNRDSLFGRYCFPQKAYEIIACRTPLVAAAVGAMNNLLARFPECLFEPDSSQSCARAMRSQLMKPIVLDFDIPSWADLAKQLEAFFEKIAA